MATPEIIASIEASEELSLERKLGVFAPISSVLVQHNTSVNPAVLEHGDNSLPEQNNSTWLTTEMELPEPYRFFYRGFAVLDSKGFESHIGVAVPRMVEEELYSAYQLCDIPEKPLWFFHKAMDGGDIIPINRVEVTQGKRRLLAENEPWINEAGYRVEIVASKVRDGDIRAWASGHEFINPLITRSIYNVIDLGEADMGKLLLHGVEEVEGKTIFGTAKEPIITPPIISRNFLISGKEQRWGWMGLKPYLPFGMLRGEEPILVGNRRIGLYNRDLKRFQGWEDDRKFVF